MEYRKYTKQVKRLSMKLKAFQKPYLELADLLHERNVNYRGVQIHKISLSKYIFSFHLGIYGSIDD
jgi:hypothetical protein